MRLAVDIDATDGRARAGTVTTGRGSFDTPCFMPVGTRGAVRHLSAVDLEELGVEVVLANTYHLMLRPGADRVAGLGGIHRFAGWDGHVLTDSGGYQILSLEPEVSDEGARFKSTYDGTMHLLTPESAVDVQLAIGSDIQMVLDVCVAGDADRPAARDAVTRTAGWADRARNRFKARTEGPDAVAPSSPSVSQFGIVQGGVFDDLRRESAERTVEIGFDGYAVGGLSVGEDRSAMLDALDSCIDLLPADQPRYFMGLGDPVGIVEAVTRGVDMFDCVLPTRLARHGTILTDRGRYNLTRSEFASSSEPLDPDFVASPAARWPRGYLRHLLNTDEPTGARIVTLHNVAWLLRFMDGVRAAIRAGELDTFRRRVHETWGAGGQAAPASQRRA